MRHRARCDRLILRARRRRVRTTAAREPPGGVKEGLPPPPPRPARRHRIDGDAAGPRQPRSAPRRGNTTHRIGEDARGDLPGSVNTSPHDRRGTEPRRSLSRSSLRWLPRGQTISSRLTLSRRSISAPPTATADAVRRRRAPPPVRAASASDRRAARHECPEDDIPEQEHRAEVAVRLRPPRRVVRACVSG